MAKASGVSFNLALSPAITGGQLKLPRSSRLVRTPQAAPVPIEDLDPGVPAIAENEERPAPGIFAKAGTHHSVKPVESFAHVTGLHQHEDLEAATEAQHFRAPRCPINSAASPASRALRI